MSAPKQQYCRFCAEQKMDNELFDLFVLPHLNQVIEEKLSFFNVGLGIDLSPASGLPKTICFPCHTSLDNAHVFLLKLRRSQAVLRQVFKDDFTKTGETAKGQVYAGLTVEVKAETPLKDEPEYKISELDIELDPFLDKGLSETSSIIDKEYKSEDDILTYMGVPIFEQDVSLNVLAGKRMEENDSWTSYPWGCQYCDKSFADMNLLREHSKKAHDLCCAFRCADCGEKCGNFEIFVEHARGHRDSLSNYCPYCNLKLKPSLLTKHIKGHRNKDNICERCGKIFDNKHYLSDHNTKYKPLKRKLNSIRKPAKVKKKKRSNPWVLPAWRTEKIENKSWSGYPWTCQMCNHEFNDLLLLRTHIKDVHGKCFGMKCVDCDDIMECYRGFAYHVRRHRPFLKQYCHYCNYKFKEHEQDTDHISQHFVDPDRLCEGCGEILPDKETYQQHITSYDPPKPKRQPFRREKPISIEDLTCTICHMVLKSQNGLRTHKIVHTERNKDFTCDRCGKAFYSKTHLQAHCLTHEELAPEICKVCNRGFKTVPLLKQHVLTHTGVKPFECEVCQKRFRIKKQLAEHSRIHTNEMPFKCQYCNKAFKHKSNVRTHEFQHTGARPYQCSECGMDFTNWANCNKHMKRRHGITLAKTMRTSRGKLPIDVKTEHLDAVKEWTEKILVPLKRGKKTKKTIENND